jgi:hypothetical protein
VNNDVKQCKKAVHEKNPHYTWIEFTSQTEELFEVTKEETKGHRILNTLGLTVRMLAGLVSLVPLCEILCS